MAENKKSFVLYCDLIHTVEQLPDEVAGKLFKLILNYTMTTIQKWMMCCYLLHLSQSNDNSKEI